MNENPYQAPEGSDRVVSGNSVTIQISDSWARRLNSPLFLVVSAFTGVSISFAPLGLLWLGIYNQWNVLTVSGAAGCFLMIYFVPLFYIRLSGQVIRQVVGKSVGA